jgi:hypothetical protein
MHKYQSQVVKGGFVSFPEFKGEKVYMLPFYKKDGLPSHLKRWQSTVDQMLCGIETEKVIYLMIDEAFVSAGKTHRRPGLHIDGYWLESKGSHSTHGAQPPLFTAAGHNTSGHGSEPTTDRGGHSTNGGHNSKPSKEKGHGTRSGHNSMSSACPVPWDQAKFEAPEAIILASNVSAAKAYEGEYAGPIKHMGACEHISTKGLREIVLEADCYRTLVRLNVPGVCL